MTGFLRIREVIIQLQWGHGSNAVEHGWVSLRTPRKRCCFNGATARMPWNMAVLTSCSSKAT